LTIAKSSSHNIPSLRSAYESLETESSAMDTKTHRLDPVSEVRKGISPTTSDLASGFCSDGHVRTNVVFSHVSYAETHPRREPVLTQGNFQKEGDPRGKAESWPGFCIAILSSVNKLHWKDVTARAESKTPRVKHAEHHFHITERRKHSLYPPHIQVAIFRFAISTVSI
jgi:hypothetical protein